MKKWSPQIESFSRQLKKYKVTIKDLLKENQKLEARAKASEKGEMKNTVEKRIGGTADIVSTSFNERAKGGYGR